jgi:hypothetical protein
MLNNLGNHLESRYQPTGQIADLGVASDTFHTAWHCATVIPFHRVAAAARCLDILIAQ